MNVRGLMEMLERCAHWSNLPPTMHLHLLLCTVVQDKCGSKNHGVQVLCQDHDVCKFGDHQFADVKCTAATRAATNGQPALATKNLISAERTKNTTSARSDRETA